MTTPRCSPATEVLDFLNSIEGAGYGGMASFEIARQHAREMVRGATQPPRPVMSDEREAPGEILELFKGGYLSVAETIAALEKSFGGPAASPSCPFCAVGSELHHDKIMGFHHVTVRGETAPCTLSRPHGKTP